MSTASFSSESGKILELDIMKFYGILLVVFGHVAMTYTPMSLIVPEESSIFMNGIKHVIYTFHMPMFVFISGCVFAYQLEIKKRNTTFVQLFYNKVKRLMIPFYVFGFLWVWPTMILLGFRNPVHYAIDGFILAIDPRHLWYVMMLFCSFLLFFGLRQLCIKCHIPTYTISLLAIGLYAFPLNFSYFQIGSTKEYFLWFSFGYFFMTHRSVAKCISALSIFILSVHYVFPVIIPTIVAKLSWAIVGISLFYLLSVKLQSVVNTHLYKWITPNSFGIYLFHAMIIYMLEFVFRTYPLNPIVLSLLIFVMSIIFSILLTIGIRRCGIAIIIGEK